MRFLIGHGKTFLLCVYERCAKPVPTEIVNQFLFNSICTESYYQYIIFS